MAKVSRAGGEVASIPPSLSESQDNENIIFDLRKIHLYWPIFLINSNIPHFTMTMTTAVMVMATVLLLSASIDALDTSSILCNEV